MKNYLIAAALLLSAVLSGCSAYDPDYDNTPTTLTTPVVSPVTTPLTTPKNVVTVRGNVYVRDNSGEVQGWLAAGETVEARCDGDWCYITGGQFDGLKFWRGCSYDNPENSGCRKEGER